MCLAIRALEDESRTQESIACGSGISVKKQTASLGPCLHKCPRCDSSKTPMHARGQFSRSCFMEGILRLYWMAHWATDRRLDFFPTTIEPGEACFFLNADQPLGAKMKYFLHRAESRIRRRPRLNSHSLVCIALRALLQRISTNHSNPLSKNARAMDTVWFLTRLDDRCLPMFSFVVIGGWIIGSSRV